MPYVNVKITKDGVTKSQKEQIVRDITNSLVKTLGKKPEHIHIVIDEVETDNWGICRHVNHGVSQEVQIVHAP